MFSRCSPSIFQLWGYVKVKFHFHNSTLVPLQQFCSGKLFLKVPLPTFNSRVSSTAVIPLQGKCLHEISLPKFSSGEFFSGSSTSTVLHGGKCLHKDPLLPFRSRGNVFAKFLHRQFHSGQSSASTIHSRGIIFAN